MHGHEAALKRAIYTKSEEEQTKKTQETQETNEATSLSPPNPNNAAPTQIEDPQAVWPLITPQHRIVYETIQDWLTQIPKTSE